VSWLFWILLIRRLDAEEGSSGEGSTADVGNNSMSSCCLCLCPRQEREHRTQKPKRPYRRLLRNDDSLYVRNIYI